MMVTGCPRAGAGVIEFIAGGTGGAVTVKVAVIAVPPAVATNGKRRQQCPPEW